MEGSDSVGDYFVFSEGQEPQFVASAKSNISSENIHPIIQTSLTARDGRNIPTLVTIPENRASSIADLPAVVMPHGGPTSYDRVSFSWDVQALANEGYAVIQPQFRGSTGFGTSHRDAGFGEWGQGMQNDVTDVVEALIS